MKNIKLILLAFGVILVSCKTSQPSTKDMSKKDYENCQEDSKIEDDILELSNLLLTVRERKQQKLDAKNELAKAQQKIREMKKVDYFSVAHEEHFSRLVNFYNYLIWD